MMFGRHPEEICQKCARPNITWYTSNALWNRVIEDKPAILCPVCFVKAAEEKGVKPTGWFLTEEADARDELSGEMVEFFREAAALGDCQDPNIGPEGGSDCEVCATCCGKYFLAKIDVLKGES